MLRTVTRGIVQILFTLLTTVFKPIRIRYQNPYSGAYTLDHYSGANANITLYKEILSKSEYNELYASIRAYELLRLSMNASKLCSTVYMVLSL